LDWEQLVRVGQVVRGQVVHRRPRWVLGLAAEGLEQGELC